MLSHKTVLFFTSLLICVSALGQQAPQVDWTSTMGGRSDDKCVSIALDSGGNIYMTGWFSGTSDFDPGAGISNVTSAGNEDIFIEKLDPQGNLLWVHGIGSSRGYEGGLAITTDPQGNVYITGQYSQTVDFDPGLGSTILRTGGSNRDIFVLKLDTQGNFVWVKGIGGTALDKGRAITVGPSGDVYVTGIFNYSVDFDPGPGTFTLASVGQNDVFVLKLSASGQFVWAKRMGDNNDDAGLGIVLDQQENVYTIGRYERTVDFDPGTGTALLSSAGSSDIFIQKLTSAGNFVWAKSMGGRGQDEGFSIDIDSNGDVVSTGWFRYTADFDPGASDSLITSNNYKDIFISKLSSTGDFVWAQGMGGSGNDIGYFLRTDNRDDIYVTGWFTGTTDFDQGSGTASVTSRGIEDIFTLKVGENGDFKWQSTSGGSGQDFGHCLAVDNVGQVFHTGTFQSTAYFPTSNTSNGRVSAGGTDIFIQRISQHGLPRDTLKLPSISLSRILLLPGESIQIDGNDYEPFSPVHLQISGDTGVIMKTTVTPVGDGSWSFTYNTISTIESGIYSVNAVHINAGPQVLPQFFKITGLQAQFGLSLDPLKESYLEGDDVLVSWHDIMHKGNAYPQHKARRSYQYEIAFQERNSSLWTPVDTVGGDTILDSRVDLATNIEGLSSGKYYRIKVKDLYKPSLLAISAYFQVLALPQANSRVSLEWDFAYPPDSSKTVIGVAADGVSRLYIKISPLSPQQLPAISSVTITLEDNLSSGARYLGKLMPATVSDTTSDEANRATDTSVTVSQAIQGDFYCWYVAPNDFVRQNSSDQNKAQRLVTANIRVLFTNGDIDIHKQEICIVRPPLMLVHGLAGSASSWKNFKSDIGVPIVHDSRFLVARAIELADPGGSFIHNAFGLVNAFDYSDSVFANSFAGLIYTLRQKGYASTQVDYVAHSMGGLVGRVAASKFKKLYTQTSLRSRVYYNYKQGYMNKFITIGSPHKGSPLADIAVRFLNDDNDLFEISSWVIYKLKPNAWVFNFIQPDFGGSNLFNPIRGPRWMTSDAVSDLRVTQTDYDALDVPFHAIASDLIPTVNGTGNALINQDFINSINALKNNLTTFERLISWAFYVEQDPLLLQQLKQVRSLYYADGIRRSLGYIETYSNALNAEPFLIDSDFVVSVSSQLSGLPRNAANVSMKHRYFHAFIPPKEIRSRSIGRRVSELLNASVSTPLFAPVPAVSNKRANSNIFSDLQDDPIPLKVDRDEAVLDLTTFDGIRNWETGKAYKIKIRLADTSNLKNLSVIFQAVSHPIHHFDTLNFIKIPATNNFIDEQMIIVEAVYDRGDSADIWFDTLMVHIIPQSPLIDFELSPQVNYLSEKQFTNLNYRAYFSDFITENANFSPRISATIDDTSVLSFDMLSKRFIAKSTGETFAIISYGNETDTAYFIVRSKLDSVFVTSIETNPTAFESSSSTSLTPFPNPFRSHTTIPFFLSKPDKVIFDVFSPIGKRVAHQELFFSNKGLQNIVFSGENLQPGAYFIILTTTDGQATGKIVKY